MGKATSGKGHASAVKGAKERSRPGVRFTPLLAFPAPCRGKKPPRDEYQGGNRHNDAELQGIEQSVHESPVPCIRDIPCMSPRNATRIVHRGVWCGNRHAHGFAVAADGAGTLLGMLIGLGAGDRAGGALPGVPVIRATAVFVAA